MRDYNEHLDGDEDGLGCARGAMLAVLLSLAFWGLVAVGFVAIKASLNADSEHPRSAEIVEVT